MYNIYKKYRYVYLYLIVDFVYIRIIESKKEVIEISDLILKMIRELYIEINRWMIWINMSILWLIMKKILIIF